MKKTEKITVRLTSDTMILLRDLVDRGDFTNLTDCVSAAIDRLIKEKYTHKEMSKILKEKTKEISVDMGSLLAGDDPTTIDDAVKKAVVEYIKNKMEPEG